MKKLHLFSIGIIVAALSFNSCDNKDDNKLFLLLFAGGMNKMPVVTLAASAYLIAEGGTSTITASIPAKTNKDVTVLFQLAGTATATADYTVPGSTIIVIPAGCTSGRTSVVITAVDDGIPEDDEDVVVGITGVTNATAGSTPTIGITDAGAMPVVSLVASASTIAEDGGTSTITASIPAVTGSAVTVVIGFAGTPTAPADYTITGSTTITIPAGLTTGSSAVVITGVDDGRLERDEVIIVSITGATNATAGTTPTIRITDDEDSLLTVMSISPASGSTGLSQQIKIIITFNKPTDGTLGTVTLTHKWDHIAPQTETVTYPGDPFCVVSFNTGKNILTIEPLYALGDPYYDIIVSGFRDADGTLMEVYENPGYIFTMKTYPWMVIQPSDGEVVDDLSHNIVIYYEGQLDDTVIGTVSLVKDPSTVITYTHGANCTISFSAGMHGSIVTVNPISDLDAPAAYSDVSVSGFKDPYGHDVSNYTFSDYDFTTVDIH